MAEDKDVRGYWSGLRDLGVEVEIDRDGWLQFDVKALAQLDAVLQDYYFDDPAGARDLVQSIRDRVPPAVRETSDDRDNLMVRRLTPDEEARFWPLVIANAKRMMRNDYQVMREVDVTQLSEKQRRRHARSVRNAERVLWQLEQAELEAMAGGHDHADPTDPLG